MPYLHRSLWEVYELHLDEAAFLWGQWERAMDAAHYTLPEVVAGPEERLRAHLDGLILGGKPVAEKLLVPALTDDDLGKVSAAAWALLHGEDADRFDLVFARLAQAEKKEERAALARAFELAERPELGERLRPLLETSAPGVQALIVDLLGARMTASGPREWGVPLQQFLESRHQALQAAAMRAVCRAPDPLHARMLEKPLASPYLAVRTAAIAAGLRLGMPAARTACSKLVARNAPGARLPLAVLAMGGEPVDVATIIRKLDVEAMRRDALWALGFVGTAAAAEAVLSWVGDAALDKVAGESFATITGVRIAGSLAKAGQSDNRPPGEGEGEDDSDVRPVQTEDSLPSPDAGQLTAWWKDAQGRYSAEARYVYGELWSDRGLAGAMVRGTTWRRRAWNLELAAHGHVTADLRSWGRHQLRGAA